MLRSTCRKTAPKVRDGKVRKKNRSAPTPNYFETPQERPVIDRQKPGAGYRHVLLQRDVSKFVGILPDWLELSRGLNAILLAPGDPDAHGWHRPGVVAICAWERDLWAEYAAGCTWFAAHRAVFEMIGVPIEKTPAGLWQCRFSESTVRAFLLLHILLHELGHHHDRMTTRSQRSTARGEGYAEEYALRYADRIWERYLSEFGLP